MVVTVQTTTHAPEPKTTICIAQNTARTDTKGDAWFDLTSVGQPSCEFSEAARFKEDTMALVASRNCLAVPILG